MCGDRAHWCSNHRRLGLTESTDLRIAAVFDSSDPVGQGLGPAELHSRYAMFTVWNASAFNGAGAAAAPAASPAAPTASRGRSRSAGRGAAVARSEPVGVSDAIVPSVPWSTGNRAADAWLNDHQLDPDVLEKFSAVPPTRRKSIVLRCMEKPPDNLSAWLCACSRNYQDQELERRVTGAASVQRPTSLSPAGGRMASSAPSVVPTAGVPGSLPDSSGLPGAVPHKTSASALLSAETSPPQFSHTLFKSWPRNKSSMLAELGVALQPETFGDILLQSATDQSALAFAIMIAAPAEPSDRDVAVRQWLRRLSSLSGSCPAAPVVQPAGASPTQQTLRLQFVMAGFGVCEAAVMVGALQKVLPRFHGGVILEFTPVICIPKADCDDVAAEDCFSRFGIVLADGITSFQTFADQLETLWQSWERDEVKVITLTNVGPHATTGRPGRKLTNRDLHAPDIRWVWMMVNASNAIRSRMGDQAVADLFLGPGSVDSDLQQQLQLLWGPELTARTASQGDSLALASRPRVWSTPGNFSVVPVLEQQQDLKSPVEGWSGPSAEQVAATLREASPLPSTVAQLAVTRLFQERALSALEAQVLQTYIVINAAGEKRLPSRAWWLRAHGMAGTPAEAVLTESFRPCLRHIISTTGLQAPPGVPATVGAPCGAQRYCRACEAFLDLLSGGYETVWTTDMLLAFVGKCVTTWTAGNLNSGVVWERSGRCDRTHHCTDGCQHVRLD